MTILGAPQGLLDRLARWVDGVVNLDAQDRELFREVRDALARVSVPTEPPKPEQVFVQPAWYLECRADGHDADSVNVREGGGVLIQCRIFRCRECDRHETVEPLAAVVAPPQLSDEPNLEALMDRAGDWQSRFFDYEVSGIDGTEFEKEAQQIISDLMLVLAYSKPQEK